MRLSLFSKPWLLLLLASVGIAAIALLGFRYVRLSQDPSATALPPAPFVPMPAERTSGTDRLVIVAGLGHSQITTAASPAWTVGQTVHGAFMIDARPQIGSRYYGPQIDYTRFDYANAPVTLLQDFDNPADSARATVGLSLGHLLKRAVGDAADVAVIQQQGWGSHLDDLSKEGDTGRYELLFQGIDRLIAWGRDQGYRRIEVHHYVLQGHRYDHGSSSWEEILDDHLATFTRDVKARTGQDEVYLFHDLCEEQANEHRTVEWFRRVPNAILVGTRYQFDYDDDFHLAPAGTFNLGALYARAIAESPVFGKAGPQLLEIARAVRSDDRVTISFSGYEGALDVSPGAEGYYNLRFFADGTAFDPDSVRRDGDRLVAQDPRLAAASEVRIRVMRRPNYENAPHVVTGRWGYVRDMRAFEGWIYEQHNPSWDTRRYLIPAETVVQDSTVARVERVAAVREAGARP